MTETQSIGLFRGATAFILFYLSLNSTGAGQTTERVSLATNGAEGNGYSSDTAPSLSSDGRFVCFDSRASNLVANDSNWTWDIFVHDRQTQETVLVSANSSGVQGNDQSNSPSISANGRFIAFHSFASNLVPGAGGGMRDIFVHDRVTGSTTHVSVNSNGVPANGNSQDPVISANGRYVAFTSWADNLASGDTNARIDVFVRDLIAQTTHRVSVDSNGVEGNANSFFPVISADGRFVAFDTTSSNLVPGDSNGVADVFLHDRQTGRTSIVSVDSNGSIGDNDSSGASISADGRFVAFESRAYNLVPGDDNFVDDVFVHDSLLGITELVSLNSQGAHGNGRSFECSISADGRHIAFTSWAINLVPGDPGTNQFDVFVHDRQSGITEKASVGPFREHGDQRSLKNAISPDGSCVGFVSEATNLVAADTNGYGDVFIYDRWNGQGGNSIYLTGPDSSAVLASVALTWHATQGNMPYWLAFSQSLSGSMVAGHHFDLGVPFSVVENGIAPLNGVVHYLSPPVPAGAAGLTVYFEVGQLGGSGEIYDSNPHGVTFF